MPGYLPRPREALRGGISKVNFQETLSNFGDKCPQNGSKNDPMAPRTTLECPNEGPSVDGTAEELRLTGARISIITKQNVVK